MAGDDRLKLFLVPGSQNQANILLGRQITLQENYFRFAVAVLADAGCDDGFALEDFSANRNRQKSTYIDNACVVWICCRKRNVK